MLRVSNGSSRRHCKVLIESPQPVELVMASYIVWYLVMLPSNHFVSLVSLLNRKE